MFHYYKNVLLGSLLGFSRVKLVDLLLSGVVHVVDLGQEVVGLAIVFQEPHYLYFPQNLHAVVLTMSEVGDQLDRDLFLGQKALCQHHIPK